MNNLLKPFLRKDRIEAGCDEAGRGCLAGPVYAAAVILPAAFEHPWLNDSKKLSQHRRTQMRIIIEKEAIAWAVARIEPAEIDEINILNASIRAMHLALDALTGVKSSAVSQSGTIRPDFLLIDGNRFKPYENIPFSCEIHGDARFAPIAAASILAKTHRDEFMAEAHLHYPQYRWDKNKGYPTKEHRHAILEHGSTELHRKSFRLTNGQLMISFEK